MADTILQHPEGRITIREMPSGKRLIAIALHDKSRYCQAGKWETAYSIELIKKILEVKGILWFCDEIIRDENPSAVRSKIERNLLNYLGKEDFASTSIMDFGCGCGSSTMNLARLFPQSEILGVELDPPSLEVAEARLKFYGYANIKFLQSPGPAELPANIGEFDYINLNAVYEHLLPGERKTLLPALWSHLKPGGVMFVSETPYRFALFEVHTTGLPLVNFFPDWLLKRTAWKLSKRIDKTMSWATMLRNGIRGGTEREILKILKNTGNKPRAMIPQGTFFNANIESWPASMEESEKCLRIPLKGKYYAAGKLAALLMKVMNRVFKFPFAGDLSLAIRKDY